MQTSIENLSNLERRLNIALPTEQIESEVETRLKRLAQTVKLHGFRPGKVPLKVVTQTYGGQVRQEVIGDTVQKTFSQAVQEQNLKVAGYPKIEIKSLGLGTNNFEFSATFEVYPEIAFGELSELKIERPSLEVNDENVDHTIEILRKQRTQYQQVQRAAQNGDKVNLNFHGTLENKEEFSGNNGQNIDFILGERQALPVFEENIIGLAAKQSKTFELVFPEDYHGKEVAGKKAIFEVTVNHVDEPTLPELNAEFAKTLGVADGDLEKMRSEIRANIENEVKRRIESRIKDQVMQGLISIAKFELPKSLVDMEAEHLMQNARKDFEARGMKAKEVPLPAELFQSSAQRRVSLGLIIAEIVKKYELNVKPEQIRAMIEELAQSYERPQDVISWYYQHPEKINEIEAIILERNVVEWAMKHAKIEEKLINFDELMGNV